MNAEHEWRGRRFFRNSRRGMLGGVCAGIADYFGFNLCATRFLTVIMLLMFTPLVILAYVACVLLVPSDRKLAAAAAPDPGFRQAMRSNPAGTLADVKRRFQKLDTRLARLERYVTSSRFNLDQEFRKL
ncbi:MAG: envelope stress response membrane protein PspC [Woeseia sp.]|nr:envelope stress response membrane protein PspC [Woeseia sp.]MBT8095827.1 envelope stress response membrane protein PspC [Woeseia sp.]NNE61723.1 envelope stress response membrane protein PspC [Woeseia sp.]NNL55081.1 envelope stress response membrane protein PspC [Woeseia sp.]